MPLLFEFNMVHYSYASKDFVVVFLLLSHEASLKCRGKYGISWWHSILKNIRYRKAKNV